MDQINENWNKFKRIEERKVYKSHSELPIFLADCILRYDKDTQTQSDVLTEIRAIEGVTIVSVVEPARRLGSQEVMRIKIKYTPIGTSIPEYTTLLQRKINKINGVLSLQVLQAVRA
jgi:hypothetical protein|tara:strand:- start:98 stop:448 length:351 start_codon:yes stop_codon:yes gene_type:complete